MSNWLHPLMAGAMATIVFCIAPIAQAADYFADAASGHDDNSGLSPAEAWQSIERINQTPLNGGDTVHLKAGNVWRESLMCQSGVEGQPVTYTSYGEGPKPTLLASVDLCSPDAWVPDGRNIWKTRQARITGNEPILSFASGDWGFYCDGQGEASMTTDSARQGSKVYTLRCRNRGERPTNIQLNCVGIALEPRQCIRYRFRAKATHPFSITDIALIQANHPWGSYGVLCRRATDITTDWQEHEVVIRTTVATPVTDGRLSFFIGSSIADGSEFSFMPLGAELVRCDSLALAADVGNIILVPKGKSEKIAGWKRWDRASLARQGDFFHDPADHRLYLYDTAMTNQGRGEGEVKDMVWRNNKTFRCEQAYEIWFSNSKMKVDRLFVTGNECVDSGYGWGHAQRPNKNGCHFLAYNLKCRIGDIRYERNTLNNARDAIIWFTNSRLSEFCIDNNAYIQDCEAPDKTKLFRWSGAPAEGVTFDAYRDATGNDRESVLRTSNPLNK